MIAAWEVVAVLVPLCSASAATGYAYARRLGEIEAESFRSPVAAMAEPPAKPEPLAAPERPARADLAATAVPTGSVPGAARRFRDAPGTPEPGAIDLGERLRPFTSAEAPPGSALDIGPPDPTPSQSPQSALNERMVPPIVAPNRAVGG